MKFLLLLLAGGLVYGAEPDWAKVENHALDFLQQYIHIRSIDPPADTAAAAQFLKAELEKNGLTPKLFPSGPDQMARRIS